MSAKRGEFLVFTSDIEWAHWNVVMALNKWSSVTWHPGQLFFCSWCSSWIAGTLGCSEDF